VRNSFRWPLAVSIIGHGCVAAVLIMLGAQLPLPVPVATSGIEITLAPPEPPPPVAETPPPPPEPPPPEPPPPPEVQPPPLEPPPPVVETEAPPPPPAPPKPALKPPPPRRPPSQPARVQAPQQTAMVPPHAAPPAPPPTGPVVSASYRLALSAWLESHKHYPESARERGEEGRAVLRFRVDRSGRVLDYVLLQSTGHPDLDASIDQMMRGASMPPFPAEMPASEVEVSVTIRFALAR
jgi:periplasmic protein TonB